MAVPWLRDPEWVYIITIYPYMTRTRRLQNPPSMALQGNSVPLAVDPFVGPLHYKLRSFKVHAEPLAGGSPQAPRHPALWHLWNCLQDWLGLLTLEMLGEANHYLSSK